MGVYRKIYLNKLNYNIIKKYGAIGRIYLFVDFGYVLFDASFFELEFANWAYGFCRVFLGGFIVIL